jgi:hypothetical protein
MKKKNITTIIKIKSIMITAIIITMIEIIISIIITTIIELLIISIMNHFKLFVNIH